MCNKNQFKNLIITSLVSLFIFIIGCDDQTKNAENNITPSLSNNTTEKTFIEFAYLKVDKKQAQLVISHYADLMYAMLTDATYYAEQLQNEINIFLANPNAKTQAKAKKAWIKAINSYMQLESLAFIKHENRTWNSFIKTYNINEGLIDYVTVDTYAESGNYATFTNIIASQTISLNDMELDTSNINLDLLINLHNALDFSTNVTTGYHVIEFLF